MSNVLIGIIGVILFIGLALAGALFLGPQFLNSTHNSLAAASIQVVNQTAHAASLRELDRGSFQEGEGEVAISLASEGYLKSLPQNPTMPTGNHSFPLRAVNDSSGGSGRATLVLMRLGNTGSPDYKVCEAIEKNLGRSGIPEVNVVPTHNSGCFRADPTMTGGVSTGNYYAYSRI